jgi:Na+-transporting methylmalonyl-CoA/oxaloacetate decarboxylase gamma subunit
MNWSQILWITLIGFLVVVLTLVLLIFIIKLFGVVFAANHKQKVAKKSAAKGEDTPAEIVLPGMVSTEEVAAIAMAMHEAVNMHDEEDTVLTINRVRRSYSPWSSKIYTLREIPKK